MIVWFHLVMAVFIFICVIMILLVLIQKGRGGGLSSAFGGSGGSTAFGSKTGDVLTWATSIVFGLFVFFAVILNLLANKIGAPPKPVVLPPAPTVPAAPAAPAGPLPELPR